jgi:hypothetical protein
VSTRSGHCSENTAGRRGVMVRRRNRLHIGQTLGVQEAFGIVIFVVVGVGSVVALLTFATSGRSYDDIGKGGFYEEKPRATPATGAAADRERDDESRQMLVARNARRVRRGEEPVDVESQLAELTATRIDPELLGEIRELVHARNRRRARAGKEPLDVEAEIERQVRDLQG